MKTLQLLNKVVDMLGIWVKANMPRALTIEKIAAQLPYVPLSDLSYSIGQTLNACFVEGERFFGNDFLPATIEDIKPNGSVKLVWQHSIPVRSSETVSYWHPSCVIPPQHIAIRI